MRRGELILNYGIFVFPVVFGLSTTVLMGVVRSAPVLSGWLTVFLLITGFVLFLTAKVSVIQSGTLFSFGTKRMNKLFKSLYVSGYVLMALAVIFIVSISLYWNAYLRFYQ